MPSINCGECTSCWGTGLYGVLGYGNATDVGDNETPQSVGAIPSVNTGSIEYDAQDRLLRFGSKLISYNANGEISSIYDSSIAQTRSYTYDVLGNLKQVVLPSKTINYGVDAFNRRMVKKNGATAEQYYLWNQNGQLIGVANGSGVLTASFVYGSKSHVPDYMITDTADYQIVSDHLGSPVAVVNSTTGVVAQEIKYDEFGRITADTNPGFIPFGFAGCLYDQDTKLCRFGARDYDASIGRWTAKDPILFAGGDTNLYGYVMQDPVNLIDPSGLKNLSSEGGQVGGDLGVNLLVSSYMRSWSFNSDLAWSNAVSDRRKGMYQGSDVAAAAEHYLYAFNETRTGSTSRLLLNAFLTPGYQLAKLFGLAGENASPPSMLQMRSGVRGANDGVCK